MAVISVKESHKQRRSGIDKDGKLTHTRIFLVTCDDAHDGTAAALVAAVGPAKVPAFHEKHPSADGTWVSDLTAEPKDDSDKHFTVTVDYAQPDFDLTAFDPDPLNAPADISYGAAESTEDYFYDRSPPPQDWNPIKDGKWKGKALVTTAGDSFEDTRPRETSELVITIGTNEATYDPPAANAFSHTINDEPLQVDGTLYPEHTLKLSPITATKVSEKVNGVTKTYYKLTKVIKYRAEGWNDDVFDQGFNQLDYPDTAQPPARTAEANVVPILNAAGVRLDKPWPLNGKGRKKKNPTDLPAVLTFRPYAWKSWSNLKWS